MSSFPAEKGLNANLENFELTDVIQLITQQLKSGFLTVKGIDGDCSWLFLKGTLINFECNFPNHTLEIKTILQQNGILNEKNLLSLPKNDNSGSSHEWEEAIFKNNFCNKEELEKINLHRLIESFVITLQWIKGRYKFNPTDKVTSNPFLVPQDANFIILEALRQIDEMAVIKKRLQPLEQIYETTLALSKNESIKNDDSLFLEGLRDQFDPREFQIYKLLNGERSLREIIDLSSTGQLHTCRILSNFIERDIISSVTTETGHQFSRSTERGQNRYLAGISLLILSCALIISTSIMTRTISSTENGRKPTLFSAIIDNLKADQRKTQAQVHKLLQVDDSSESIDQMELE